MRKRILFINLYFCIGGIQSSLINMANELCNYYDVDILSYYPEGELKSRLNPRVNILQPSWALKSIGMLPKQAIKTKNPIIILFRILGSIWSRIFDNRFPIYIATKCQPKLKGYDLAIAYRAETRLSVITSGYARVLDRCVEARKKAVWIHFDANTINASANFNRKYYKNIDKIVGVSQSVMRAFERVNPTLSEKMDYCYNFLDYENIIKKSEITQTVQFQKDKFICFSACRLSEEKEICRAIKALKSVFYEHRDVVWYIAGDGPERQNIEAAIKSAGLEKNIILIGNQVNPYPYIKNSDLIMCLSRHEAAPMIYLEAKALHIPVFSTVTSSSYEMLKDGVEDFICENSEEGIRTLFSELMNNRQKIYDAKKSLESYRGSNEKSLKKFTEWI